MSAVLYFISSATVAKYKEILDDITPGKKTVQESSVEQDTTKSNKKIANLEVDQPRLRSNTWSSSPSSPESDVKVDVKRRFSDAEDIESGKCYSLSHIH